MSDKPVELPEVDDLGLRFYPDPVLKRRGDPVGEVTEAIRLRVRRMFDVMYDSGGIGIAAPQVGWSVRIFVVNLTANPDCVDEEMVFIDPVVLDPDGTDTDEEGCLSFPDLRLPITRPDEVLVRATDLDGQRFEIEADGLLARCVQHELDHLDGILFVDRAGFAAKLSANRVLKNLEREYKADRKK